ncbi:hypothetical protein HYC85_000298 [Camellia sinensis]|uniref:Trichome birefringence-like C-terminal domain-containing protein n=1 Tax=Camellia sinensis TaxID=4442 RepID=A0A7J7I2D2_CAMSI|nr:hypothetical protein HYC85_000298 [Camellia sinensis]
MNSGNNWKGMDMLIFNTWHWWNYRNALQPWDYIQVRNQVMKDMDRMAAFERSLNTRGGWVDTNTNPMKTMEHGASSSSKLQLVRNQQAEQNTATTKPVSINSQITATTEQTISKPTTSNLTISNQQSSRFQQLAISLAITKTSSRADQFNQDGTDWNEPKANKCTAQTATVAGSTYAGKYPPAGEVVKRAIRKIKNPVILLDITTLSLLRKDGHPSIYGNGGTNGVDCTHWCIAGVPDTWNQILYNIVSQKNQVIT